MSSEFCIVLTTCPSKKQAEKIANELVNLKLAACVQITQPITSVYQWDGEIVTDAEIQIVIKTLSSKLDFAHKLLLSLHPYDVPQWIVIDIASGGETYLDWIKSNLK